jgi:hypothetical protein
MSRRLGEVLPLQVFIRQRQVTNMFRSLLRAARHNPDHALRLDLKKQVRDEFRRHRETKDSMVVRSLLQEAQRSLKMLQDMRTTPSTDVVVIPNTPSNGMKSKPGGSGSWLEGGDEEDKRGRVGEGWPWEQQ